MNLRRALPPRRPPHAPPGRRASGEPIRVAITARMGVVDCVPMDCCDCSAAKNIDDGDGIVNASPAAIDDTDARDGSIVGVGVEAPKTDSAPRYRGVH